ncbi:MAG: hypothetical protein ROZ64_18215 [Burkholderiaceae bacterium]|jgi:hypothetical protein|nr:hypothetical protein [Burkholderiaceae bacterium]
MPRTPSSHRYLAVLIALLLPTFVVGCGGGGGGADEVPSPAHEPKVTLTGSALDAEKIALAWKVDAINADQAYAITVDGVFATYTTAQGYAFTAAPDTRYCFTVVVGALAPPMNAFVATGPTSNELCITTPSLPPLAPGWTVSDAGMGNGQFPAIARRAPGAAPGLYACVAKDVGDGGSVFRMLGSSGMVFPSFAYDGTACAVADNGSFDPILHAVTNAGSFVTYRNARPVSGGWFFTGDQPIAANADPGTSVSMAIDASLRPQVLYRSGGHAYWSGKDATGGWSVPEPVGPGNVGWRSLAVAADGVVYALLAEGDHGVRVWRRNAPGAWSTVYVNDGALNLQSTRGPGSIVTPADGGVRLVFRRAGGGVIYVEWPGDAVPWSETLVDAETDAMAPALALDLAGEPLIAYGDSRHDLRLTRRSAGQWNTVRIDALGDLALHTDVEVDGEGVVYILYSDSGGAAKLATAR